MADSSLKPKHLDVSHHTDQFKCSLLWLLYERCLNITVDTLGWAGVWHRGSAPLLIQHKMTAFVSGCYGFIFVVQWRCGSHLWGQCFVLCVAVHPTRSYFRYSKMKQVDTSKIVAKVLASTIRGTFQSIVGLLLRNLSGPTFPTMPVNHRLW